MSSTQLRTLLKPPARTDSQRKATETINLQFHCFEDLKALDASVVESEEQQNTLRSNVWSYFLYPRCRTQIKFLNPSFMTPSLASTIRSKKLASPL